MKSITALFLSTLTLACQPAAAQVSITAIADSSTAIPGGIGNFTSFAPVGYPPVPWISFGNVAFFGAGSGGQAGIFSALGGSLTTIANQNTVIPGGTQDSRFIIWQSNPALSGNNVAFAGGNATRQGLYASIGGVLTTVSDVYTPIPGGGGNFIIWQSPGISGTEVAFIGQGPAGPAGVYKCLPPSPCLPVADTTTSIPGGAGNFIIWQSSAISGGNVAFIGGDNLTQTGVYAAVPPGPIAPVADTTTQAPGQAPGTPFFRFANVSLSGANIAFRGLSSPALPPPDAIRPVFDGVYVAYPPSPWLIAKVADTNTLVPGSLLATFSAFGNVAIDPNNVAFEGFSGTATEGIYASIGGALLKIIDTNDTLNGQSITGVFLGPGGFSGDQIAFGAELGDGSQAIAVATLNGNRCPLSQGYWKNHASLWPETSLLLGNQNYSQTELLAILNTNSGGDASLILAKQLIAAKLNIFNGANPAPASGAIATADSLLSGFSGKLPYNVPSTSPLGQQMTSVAATLENYNSGALTPGCTN